MMPCTLPSRSAPRVLVALLLATAALPLHAQRPVPEPATRRPPGPETVTAVRTGPTEVTIRWTPVEGASGYEIGRHAPPNGWQRAGRVGAGVTAFRDAGRNLAVPHRYRVVALVGALATLPAMSDTVGGSGAPVGGGAGGSDHPTTPGGSCLRRPDRSVVCHGGARDWDASRGEPVLARLYCPSAHAIVSGGHSGEMPFGSVTTSWPEPGTADGDGWSILVTPVWGRGPAPDVFAPLVADGRARGRIFVKVICSPP